MKFKKKKSYHLKKSRREQGYINAQSAFELGSLKEQASEANMHDATRDFWIIRHEEW